MDPSNNNAFDSFGNNAGAGNGASVGGASAGAGIGSGATITSPNTGATNSGSIVSSGATAVNNEYTSNSFPEGGLTIGGDKKRSRKGLIIAGIVLFVLAIGGGLAALAAMNGMFWGGSNNSQGRLSAYDLINAKQKDVGETQIMFINARDGEVSSYQAFVPGVKERVDLLGETMGNFHLEIKEVNTGNLPDSVVENIKLLREDLDENISVYENTVHLYDLFYDYVSNDFDAQIATSIKELNNEKAVEALNKFDKYIEEYGLEDLSGSSIIADIFSVYTSDSSFDKVDYYKIMGDIVAELQPNE